MLKTRSFLCLCDSFITIFIFAPLITTCWRGYWHMADLLLFPKNMTASVIASTSFGIIVSMILNWNQTLFSKISYSEKPILFVFVSRFHNWLYSLASIHHWRGVWYAWDHFTGMSLMSCFISTFLGLNFLCLLRGVVNLVATPFVAVSDHPNDFFVVGNWSGTKRKDGIYHFLDIFMSVAIIGSLVVFVWRGVWVFLENVLFPTNPLYSAIASLVIGYAVTIVCFIAQLWLPTAMKNVDKGYKKIFIEDTYFTICLFGCINVWRGVWNLLNVLFLPDQPLLSNLITAVFGNAVMLLLQSGNSIPVRGAQMDGEKEGSQGVILSTEFLRYFYKMKNKPKETQKSKMYKSEDIDLSPNGLLGRDYE